MKTLSLAIIFILPVYFATAQTLRRPVGSSAIGLGAYSNTHADAFSFNANQASLARFNSVSAGVYGERRFMLDELSLYNLAFTLPTNAGNFGIKGGYYGFAGYNETQAAIAYGRKLGNKIDIGVQFNYNALNIGGYGNTAAVSFEAGTIFHLTEKLNAGVHINNPIGGEYNKGDNEKLPFLYTAGLGYEASGKFYVSAEIQKEEDQPVNVHAGLQYKFLPQLLARGGVATATSSYWLGIGVGINQCRIDAIASYHPQLGITPGVMLLFNFKTLSVKEDQSP